MIVMLQIASTILVLCMGVLLICYIYEENDDYYIVRICSIVAAMGVILINIWLK